MSRQAARLTAIGVIAAVLVVPLSAAAVAKKPPARRAAAPFAGPKGYVEVSTDFTAPVGQDTSGVQACPAGLVILGGGVYSSGGLDLAINSDVPTKNNKGWRASAANTGTADSAETVYAICGNKPAAYKVVRKKADNPANRQTDIDALCPSGSKVLGGGGSSLQAGPQYFALGGSFPETLSAPDTSAAATTAAWGIEMNNGSPSTDNTATAVAICGKGIKGYVLKQGLETPNPAGTASFAFADCPGSKVSLSGGLSADSGSVLVTINESYPDSTGWFGDENNKSGENDNIYAWVVCAK